MKRLLALFLMVCFLLPCFSACGDEDNSTTVSGNMTAEVTDLYETAPAGDAASGNYALQSSFKDDTYWYYIYYMGRVRGVPVSDGAISTNAFHYTGNTEISKELKITEMTSETVAKAIEKSNSVTDGWSQDVVAALATSLSGTVSVSQKVGASAELGVFAGSTETSREASVTASLQLGMEEAFGITSTTQNTLVQYESAEKSKTYTTEKTMTFRFIPNESREGWYKYTMVGTVDVFAVVIYNPAEKQASVTSVSEWAALYEELVYSEDEFFTNQVEKLTLDKNVLRFEEPTKYYQSVSSDQLKPPAGTQTGDTVEIDLSAFYASDKDTVKVTNLAHEFFDSTTGTFTVKDTYGGKQVKKYVFRGLYHAASSSGALYQTVLENLHIVVDASQDVEIVLDHVALRGSGDRALISLNASKPLSNKVKLTAKGECLLLGANGADAAKNTGADGKAGIPAIDFSSSNNVVLLLAGDGVLTVRGGDGGKGAKGTTTAQDCSGNGGKGGKGGNGAIAILVNRLEASEDLTLFVYGGNGGKGGNGGNSVNTHLLSANPAGSGNVGGNGNVATNSPSVILTGNAKVSVYGGCGGNGGNGGYRCTWGSDGDSGSAANGGTGSAALLASASLSGTLVANQSGSNGAEGSKGGDWNSQGGAYNEAKYWEN